MVTCQCGASRKTFNAEVAFHFPGLDGLKKPIVWVFPQIEVCLTCGAAEFVVPDRGVNRASHREDGGRRHGFRLGPDRQQLRRADAMASRRRCPACVFRT